jgi:hypothetical protein
LLSLLAAKHAQTTESSKTTPMTSTLVTAIEMDSTIVDVAKENFTAFFAAASSAPQQCSFRLINSMSSELDNLRDVAASPVEVPPMVESQKNAESKNAAVVPATAAIIVGELLDTTLVSTSPIGRQPNIFFVF